MAIDSFGAFRCAKGSILFFSFFVDCNLDKPYSSTFFKFLIFKAGIAPIRIPVLASNKITTFIRSFDFSNKRAISCLVYALSFTTLLL